MFIFMHLFDKLVSIKSQRPVHFHNGEMTNMFRNTIAISGSQDNSAEFFNIFSFSHQQSMDYKIRYNYIVKIQRSVLMLISTKHSCICTLCVLIKALYENSQLSIWPRIVLMTRVASICLQTHTVCVRLLILGEEHGK